MLSIGKRKLSVSAAVLALVVSIWPGALHSQSCCSYFPLEVLETQQMGMQFQRLQMDSRAWHDHEHRNVPIYNARLNIAVIAFHKHITQDDHYLITNCALCRKHLRQITSYSKKLDRAMK
jgi:hypothetical protein